MDNHVDPYRYYLHFPSADASIDTAPDKDAEAEKKNLLRLTSLYDFYVDPAEDQAVGAELFRLFRAFRTSIVYGQRHYAPSPTWRDELTMAGDIPAPARFVLRVHLFEDRGGEPGRYLGFVSLRPPGYVRRLPAEHPSSRHCFAYVIDAELTAPAHMQRPRYHLLTTTASSARLGVLPFRSAVYSAAGATALRGSTCVHLAVSQALHIVMGRFPCRPISQIEFDWHLWKQVNDHTKSISQMGARGASLAEALRVVRASCNGGGFHVTVEPRDPLSNGRLSSEERRLALRFLTDALACGLPVITLVRTGNLLPDDIKEELRKEGGEKHLNAPHAVLILGMHLLHSLEECGKPLTAHLHSVQRQPAMPATRDDIAELPGRVVIHDTLSRGPYFECLISDFLEAAEQAYDGIEEVEKRRENQGVHFLVLGPPGLEMSLAQARIFAESTLRIVLRQHAQGRLGQRSADEDLRSLDEYLKTVDVKPEDAAQIADWRLICRFLSMPEISSRYLGAGCPGLEPSGRQNPRGKKKARKLDPGYYWAVEVRHPYASRRGTGESIYGPSDLPPALVYIWNSAITSQKRSIGCSPQITLRFAISPPDPHGQPS